MLLFAGHPDRSDRDEYGQNDPRQGRTQEFGHFGTFAFPRGNSLAVFAGFVILFLLRGRVPSQRHAVAQAGAHAQSNAQPHVAMAVPKHRPMPRPMHSPMGLKPPEPFFF